MSLSDEQEFLRLCERAVLQAIAIDAACPVPIFKPDLMITGFDIAVHQFGDSLVERVVDRQLNSLLSEHIIPKLRFHDQVSPLRWQDIKELGEQFSRVKWHRESASVAKLSKIRGRMTRPVEREKHRNLFPFPHKQLTYRKVSFTALVFYGQINVIALDKAFQLPNRFRPESMESKF